MKTEYRTVAVPRALVDRAEAFMRDHPELGYRSAAELTIEALRDKLHALQDRMRAESQARPPSAWEKANEAERLRS